MVEQIQLKVLGIFVILFGVSSYIFMLDFFPDYFFGNSKKQFKFILPSKMH